MLATSVFDDAIAWIGLPLLFVLSALGVGLLIERALSLRLPAPALLPLGFTASVCALLAVYRLQLDAHVGAPLLVLAAAAGFVLARGELRERFAPGPAAALGAAVLALYLAPTVLTGHWSWNGYNFLNDTSVQFVLADQLQHHGVQTVQDAHSTRSESIRSYIDSGYPLGTHAHLATLAALLGSGVDVIYQSYLALLAVTAAVSLHLLARLSGLAPWRAAAAAGGAMSASLIYHYALQGSIKELGAFTCLAAAAMFGAQLLESDRPARAVVPVGLAAAAMLSVFSSAAGPYLVVLALALAGAAFLMPASPVRRSLLPVAAVGAGVALVAAIPTLLSAFTFLQVSDSALGADSVATSTLGQLQRPLEAIQVAGVWLSEDYGLPVSGESWSLLTDVLSAFVLVLAVAAAVGFLRRRVPGPLPLLLAVLVTAAVIAPRASPYADAKMLAIAAPAVVFTALCGALACQGRLRRVAVVAAAVVGASVTTSAAFAYHGTRLAPTERLRSLEDVVDRVAASGWILLDEVEEFGKYYGRAAPNFNVGFEALTPRQARPFGGGYHVDLDQLEPAYVQEFDAIVTRIGPGTSRPPGNYRHVYGNGHYEAWERIPGVRVKQHLPLGDTFQAGSFVGCRQVRELARGAGARDRLLAATAPENVQLPVADAPDRPLGWPPRAAPPGVIEPRTPGIVEDFVMLEGGTYDAWVRASTGRTVHASVDGRHVGSVEGINSQGQWLHAGSVALGRGRHLLRLERPGGDLTPGDGAASVLGPLALVRHEARRLREVRPGRWRELCGERWDWIEVVER